MSNRSDRRPLPRISLLVLAVLLATAAGCGDRDVTAAVEIETGGPMRSAPPPSAAASIDIGDLGRRAGPPGWVGVVVTRESVDVKADSQGRLQSMQVSIGDRVRKGDPIATLDTSLAAQDLEMARSVLRGAQADERRTAAELAEAQARNDRRQKNPDFFSKEDLAQAALQAKTAQAAYDGRPLACRRAGGPGPAARDQPLAQRDPRSLRWPGGRALRRSRSGGGPRHPRWCA